MDSDFYKKVFDDDDDDDDNLTDEDMADYEARLIKPSDIDIPAFTAAQTYAMILDVPIDVGRVVQEAYLFGKRRAREEEKDAWERMEWTAEHDISKYLQEVNWYHGVVIIFSPPIAGMGQYAGITMKGLEKLVGAFPSDSYKKRKQVK